MRGSGRAGAEQGGPPAELDVERLPSGTGATGSGVSPGCVPRRGRGRPRRTPASVSADKAYSNRKIRSYLRKRGIRHVIPEKKDHKAARLRRGSRGGRPPGFD